MQPNSLAFIALSNEFCSALEHLATGGEQALATRQEFVASMLNYIPRLYISASDLQSESEEFDDFSSYSDYQELSEEHYEAVRRSVEAMLGEEDVYLEVFEDDMKYSDTPISASVSEGLADIFQSLYNFIETVRDAPGEQVASALSAAKDDFEHYWSRIACNVLRALNNIRYFSTSTDE